MPGNPPFVGVKFQNSEQRAQVYPRAGLGRRGTQGYVSAWFVKVGSCVVGGRASALWNYLNVTNRAGRTNLAVPVQWLWTGDRLRASHLCPGATPQYSPLASGIVPDDLPVGPKGADFPRVDRQRRYVSHGYIRIGNQPVINETWICPETYNMLESYRVGLYPVHTPQMLV